MTLGLTQPVNLLSVITAISPLACFLMSCVIVYIKPIFVLYVLLCVGIFPNDTEGLRSVHAKSEHVVLVDPHCSNPVSLCNYRAISMQWPQKCLGFSGGSVFCDLSTATAPHVIKY